MEKNQKYASIRWNILLFNLMFNVSKNFGIQQDHSYVSRIQVKTTLTIRTWIYIYIYIYGSSSSFSSSSRVLVYFFLYYSVWRITKWLDIKIHWCYMKHVKLKINIVTIKLLAIWLLWLLAFERDTKEVKSPPNS